MTLTGGQSFIIILVIAVVTFMTRAIPFLLFNRQQGETSPYIVYIGKVLPPAVIGMLIIYCVKNVSLLSKPYGIPELVSIAAVALLHFWKRNNLLSILGGTIIYMIIVQLII